MPVLPIRQYGDPVLRETAQPIATIDDTLRQLAADMGETMYAANGIGLAANQIGQLIRIVVIDVDEEYTRKVDGKRQRPKAPHLEVFLNPEIVSSSDDDGTYSEGCLSIPGLEGNVYRPNALRLRWMDLEGATHEADVDGLRARVLQHEIDHLNGVLFIDRMEPAARRALAGQLAALRAKTAPNATS